MPPSVGFASALPCVTPLPLAQRSPWGDVEAREQYLPSGTPRFATLQAIEPAGPALVGPFVAAMEYDADDSGQLRASVLQSALPVAHKG